MRQGFARKMPPVSCRFCGRPCRTSDNLAFDVSTGWPIRQTDRRGPCPITVRMWWSMPSKGKRWQTKEVSKPIETTGTAEDFEKLGVFYLGRPYDLAAKQV